jgi:uncharacterized membrane protein HdeD (DUF308 family)
LKEIVLEAVFMESPVMSSRSVAIRSIVALGLGLIALLRHDQALVNLVSLFGAYALVAGILALVSAAKHNAEYGRRWMVLEGIAGILIGLATFARPGITLHALTYLIATWAIMTGIFEIVGGIRMRKHIKRAWLYQLAGILSVFFGIQVIGLPLAGASAVTWLLGFYGLLFGIVLLGLSFKLRNLERNDVSNEERRRAA